MRVTTGGVHIVRGHHERSMQGADRIETVALAIEPVAM
jgi:hypothetical protein